MKPLKLPFPNIRLINGILPLAIILSGALCFGQDKSTHTDTKIDKTDLKQYILTLTSDSLEGRGTGTVGQQKAAEIIANKFRDIGLQPYCKGSFYQPFYLKQTYWGEVYLKSDGQLYNNFEDIVFEGYSAENTEIDKELVFGGWGTDEDLKQIDVKDKIVFLFCKPLRSYQRLCINLGKRGAYGFILANPDDDTDFENYKVRDRQTFFRKHISEMKNGINIYKYLRFDSVHLANSVLISNEKIKDLMKFSKNELKKAGNKNNLAQIPSVPVKVKFEKICDTLETANICGFIPGNSDKSIIISAHYDHLGVKDHIYFPGADDNASGTAALMELAEEFIGNKDLRYNLIFLATSAEENGMLGAKAFVADAGFDSSKIVCNLNMDMIARADNKHGHLEKYLYCLGYGNSTELKSILTNADESFQMCTFDYSLEGDNYNTGIFSRSDQYIFYKKNIPSILFFTGLHADLHKPTDTADKINYNVYLSRVQLIGRVVKLLETNY